MPSGQLGQNILCMAVRTGLTERFVLLLLSSLLGLARKRRGQRGGTGVCRSFVSQRPFLLISVLSRGVRSRTGPRRLHPCLSSSFSHARHAVSSVALAFSFFFRVLKTGKRYFQGEISWFDFSRRASKQHSFLRENFEKCL